MSNVSDWREVIQRLLTACTIDPKNQPLALQIDGDHLVAMRLDTQGIFSTKRASWRDLNSRWVSVTAGLDPNQLSSLRNLYELANSGGAVNWKQFDTAGLAALQECLERGIVLYASAEHDLQLVTESYSAALMMIAEKLSAEKHTTLKVEKTSFFDPAPLANFFLAPAICPCLNDQLLKMVGRSWKLSDQDALEFWGNWAPQLVKLGALGATGSELLSEHRLSPAHLEGQLQLNPSNSQQLEIKWVVRRNAHNGAQLRTVLEPESVDNEVENLMRSVCSLISFSGAPKLFFQRSFPVWELEFVRELVQTINQSGRANIHEAQELTGIKIYAQGPKLDLNLDGDSQQGYTLRLGLQLNQETLSSSDFLAGLQRNDRWWQSPEGSWIDFYAPKLQTLKSLIEEFRQLGLSEFKLGDGLEVGLSHLGLVSALHELSDTRQLSTDWEKSVHSLLNPDKVELPQLPSGRWRAYQEQGFHWLHARAQAGLGGVLADDMGLGKTLQILALISSRRQTDSLPVLVVVPSSLLVAWKEQIEQWFSHLKVKVFTSSVGRTETEHQRARLQAEAVDIILTTYTLIRIDVDFWSTWEFSGLILDEAQAVKNPDTATYHALTRLKSGWSFALTGTPIENKPTDLWSILSLTVPKVLPGRKNFEKYFAKDMNLTGISLAASKLSRQVSPFVLRRTKAQVASDLPEKIEQTITLQMQPIQQSLYRKYLEIARRQVNEPDIQQFNVLTTLTRLRQLALSARLVDTNSTEWGAKLDYLLVTLRDLVDEGHQTLVFSQFTSFLSLLRKRLEDNGVPYAYLDGSTRYRSREVELFQNREVPVFLISLKAGGFGLNLTAANYVFLCDPWWNPAVENQAVDRAHRLGQSKTVNVYRLVADKTIETRVLELQERKRNLINEVLSSQEDSTTACAITLEDLRRLLRDSS